MHGHPENIDASSWLCAMRTNHGSSSEPYDEIGVEVCRNVQHCACGRGYLHAADVSSWKRNKKVAVFVLCSLIRGTMEGAMHHGL